MSQPTVDTNHNVKSHPGTFSQMPQKEGTMETNYKGPVIPPSTKERKKQRTLCKLEWLRSCYVYTDDYTPGLLFDGTGKHIRRCAHHLIMTFI